jgi:hypothetical protein
MKSRTKIILISIPFLLVGIFGLGGTWLWYLNHYVHQHCIKGAGMDLQIYAGDHYGRYPFSTNGFGDALLSLTKESPDCIHNICGPDDDGHIFREALTNHSIVPEEKCSRVYIQGLCETNDPQICILFDRNSCRGGDHFRSPWGHRVHEVCLLDGSMQVIPDEKWPEFSRQQVDLLVAAGFSRTNALHFFLSGRKIAALPPRQNASIFNLRAIPPAPGANPISRWNRPLPTA